MSRTRSVNEPSARERMSWFWSIIIAWLPTSLLDVANQSWKISVSRSTSGWSERTIRSSHQRWSWPQASSGANGVPLGSVTGAPTSVAAPDGPGQAADRRVQAHRGERLGLAGLRAEPGAPQQALRLLHAERAAVDERVGAPAAGRAAGRAVGLTCPAAS